VNTPLVLAFAPIWALTGLGYLGRRYQLLPPSSASVLSRFVFQLAMPVALFLTVSKTGFDRPHQSAAISFAIGALAVGAIAYLVSGRVFGRDRGERAMASMLGGYVNSANLGLPVAAYVLRDTSFLLEVLIMQVMIMTPLVLAFLDHATTPGRSINWRRMATLPLRNPIIIGAGLGALWSAAGWTVPELMTTALKPLAEAAVPTALVALGASLVAAPGNSAARTEVAVLTAVKSLLHPLIVFLVGRYAFGLHTHELLAAVVCAALPTAQNTFIIATEYRVLPDLANRVVVASTAVSMLVLGLVALWLGGLH